jgi:hypothetical protein
MAQQTAVEWLVEQLRLPTNIRFTDDEKSSYKELIEQAKEIEKQHIVDAWQNGANYVLNVMDKEENPNSRLAFETYYTQTYGTRLQNETN